MDPALVFDPSAVGAQTSFAPRPQPTVNTQQPGMDDNWSRILQAAKQGLITPDRLQQLAQHFGYTAPGQPQQGKPQEQQPSNIGGQLGQTLGQTVGRVGQSVNKQMQQQPNPELQIAKPGVNIPDDQQNKMYTDQLAPSPGWNQ